MRKSNVLLGCFLVMAFFLSGCASHKTASVESGKTTAGTGQQSTVVVPDADKDGVPDDLDHCPDTPKGVAVKADGCAVDSDGDGVPDYIDQCPYTPGGAKVNKTGCQAIAVQRVETYFEVHFDVGKAVVRGKYDNRFSRLNNWLKEHPGAQVKLIGHTDSTGSKAFNQRLSVKRAKAVEKVLVQRFNLDAAHITTQGYGETRPIADNSTKAGRAKNRRVEVEASTKSKTIS